MADIVHSSAPPSHSGVTHWIERLMMCGAIVPYALVALLLRLLMAKVFFFSGQSKITGNSIPLNIQDFGFSVTLPESVRGSVIQMFDAKIPFVGAAVGYAYAYAEFVLPILLVLGLATRISALLLLIMTVLLQVFFAPEALWTTHVYWASILLVLMSVGPGQVSMDQIVRDIYER
jgi:putative oxidoreductase